MNCGAMLELILEADPVELAGQRDSVLARHLRGCAPCRAVAHQILADTKRLERALATPAAPSPHLIVVGPRGRSTGSRRLAAAVLVAAAVAVVVLRGAKDATNRYASSPVVRPSVARTPEHATAATRRPPLNVATSEGAAAPRTTAARVARRVGSAPVAPVAFPTAPAVEPARFAFSSTEPDTPPPAAVALLDPISGKRVAILRTSDPTVTVFWLY